ncbi:50S ribosomal protein L10 [Candidatus Woesearchaeota archaeon]|nr:50S ribosomal protein L10 [Candidatus Woesearchaeota archaeon]
MAHISPFKKKVVAEYSKLIVEYPIIAAVNMENLPTRQLQAMRATLRGKVVMKMSKRRLMALALKQSAEKKAGVDKLVPYLKGMPALLFTKENPFSLYKTLEKNKSTAPIKGGQTAPKDIVVPAGPTTFAPGPIIGQLGQVGIAAGIDQGKVAIKKDSLVAKAGAQVKPELAAILARLGIEPMEIGLDVTAAFENGTIYTKDILSIDEKKYIDNVALAHQCAFNLAIEVGILTKDTTEFMIQKAFRDSRALAIEQSILADLVVGDVLAKARNEMLALASELPDDAKSEDLRC